MNIYSKQNTPTDPIQLNIKEIDYFTRQLGDFLKLYEERVYIEDDTHRHTLALLHNIHLKLMNHQFNEIINDTSIIQV